jgi:hypothetical protein
MNVLFILNEVSGFQPRDPCRDTRVRDDCVYCSTLCVISVFVAAVGGLRAVTVHRFVGTLAVQLFRSPAIQLCMHVCREVSIVNFVLTGQC